MKPVGVIRTEGNQDSYESYGKRLKDKLFKILCDREENKNWEAQLNTFIMLLLGTKDALNVDTLEVLTQVSSLRYLDMKYFRKTVFEAMNTIDKIFIDK